MIALFAQVSLTLFEFNSLYIPTLPSLSGLHLTRTGNLCCAYGELLGTIRLTPPLREEGLRYTDHGLWSLVEARAPFLRGSKGTYMPLKDV